MTQSAMTPAFESDLDQALAFLKDPPKPGSPEDKQLMDVLERIRRGYEVLPDHVAKADPITTKLDDLDRHIKDVAAERYREQHSHDMSHPPGMDGVGPLLGWDLRRA